MDELKVGDFVEFTEEENHSSGMSNARRRANIVRDHGFEEFVITAISNGYNITSVTLNDKVRGQDILRFRKVSLNERNKKFMKKKRDLEK